MSVLRGWNMVNAAGVANEFEAPPPRPPEPSTALDILQGSFAECEEKIQFLTKRIAETEGELRHLQTRRARAAITKASLATAINALRGDGGSVG